MLDTHEQLLKDEPELQALRVLGLFDRDIGETLVWRLTDPPVVGLTDVLHRLRDDMPQWNRVVSRLADLNLIIVTEARGGRILHCHPLVREYQNERLKTILPDAWKTANRRLFTIFQKMVKAEQPDDENDIFLLYRAMSHGCAGGLYEDAFHAYWHRVSRGEERFSTDRLGLVNEDLKALGGFAKPATWTPVTKGLSRERFAEILDLIGFRLRTLGRTREAERVFRRALAEFKSLRRWRDASTQANNLAVMLRMLGRLSEAVDESTQALSYARKLRKPRDRGLRVQRLAALGEIYHYLGEDSKARAQFKKAEDMQVWPHQPYLRSTLGFRYCEFLLDTGDAPEALKRSKQIKVPGTARYALLDGALQQLCEGRAKMLLSEGHSSRLEVAEKILHNAYLLARRSVHRDNRIRTAVALAEVHRRQGKDHFVEARRLLTEAASIAKADGMYLHQLDCEYELLQLDAAEGKSRQQIMRGADELANRVREIEYGLLTKKLSEFMRAIFE